MTELTSGQLAVAKAMTEGQLQANILDMALKNGRPARYMV